MKNNSSIYSRYFTYIKPITKIPIVRNYGHVIFTILVTSIFIIFAIKPTVETIVILQKKLIDSTQVLEKINKKAENLSQGKQNYENIDHITSKISAAIPDTAELKSVTATLEQTAKNHDASVSALQIQPLIIEPKTENSVGTLSEISFTFNTTGAYQNLISVLQDLKRSDRLISIDSLSISTLNEGTGVIMSVSGKSYYLK